MNVVVTGGGVAGLEAVMALRDMAGDSVDITLVAPDESFVFRPMSVGEPFALGDAQQLELKRFANDFDAELASDSLASVAPREHQITLGSGGARSYDKLLVAVGGRRVPAFESATAFRGQEDSEAVHGLVQDIEAGYVKRVAFVVPPGVAWSLPLYELALQTARRAREMNVDVELTLVTPEDHPLQVFGAPAATEVQELLRNSGIELLASSVPELPRKGVVLVHPSGREIEADRVIALPVVEGLRIDGLPSDGGGFIPIDEHCRVSGADDVWAAGDGTNFPVKQGGIACQQADAAASDIAAQAGAGNEPEPFRPVLHGRLITGGEQVELSSDQTLWWPPAKIAGRYLAPYLDAGSGGGDTREYELKA